MTARFFADTNIAVYALDADPVRREKAFALMRQRPVISAQIVNEFLNVLTGKQRVQRDVANRYARILLRRCEEWSPSRRKSSKPLSRSASVTSATTGMRW